MKKSIKKIVCYSITSLLVASLVGCTKSVQTSETQKTGEKAHLKIYAQYSDDSEKIPFDYAVQEMKKVMPNVEVEIMPEARDDGQKLKTYAAAGNLPDIFDASSDIIKTFEKSKNILQLDSYAKELKIEDQMLDSVKPILRDEDGHIYGVPTDAPWYSMIFYNKEVFEKNGVKPPTNYNEMIDAIKKFKEKGIIPLALFAKEKWPGVQLFDQIATRMDPKGILLLDKGTAKVSDDVFKKTADKISNLVSAGMLAPGAFNMGYDEALSLFAEGKAAMLLNGGWAIQDFGAKMPGKAGILIYPFADAGQEEAVMYQMSGGGTISGYGVSPYSKNKDVAAKYAIQLSLKISEGRVLKRGAFPIVKNSLEPEKPYTDIQKEYNDYASKVKTSTTFDWGFTNATVKTTLEDNIQKLLTGHYSVDNFVSDTDKAIANARK